MTAGEYVIHSGPAIGFSIVQSVTDDNITIFSYVKNEVLNLKRGIVEKMRLLRVATLAEVDSTENAAYINAANKVSEKKSKPSQIDLRVAKAAKLNFSYREVLIGRKYTGLDQAGEAVTADALSALLDITTNVIISGNPASATSEASEIAEAMGISESSALHYYRKTTDKSHGAKYDIIIDVTHPLAIDLDARLGVGINLACKFANDSEAGIGSKELALILLRSGFVPAAV